MLSFFQLFRLLFCDFFFSLWKETNNAVIDEIGCVRVDVTRDQINRGDRIRFVVKSDGITLEERPMPNRRRTAEQKKNTTTDTETTTASAAFMRKISLSALFRISLSCGCLKFLVQNLAFFENLR